MMNTLRFSVCLFGALLAAAACTSDPKVVDSCGDGLVDPGEECDLNAGDQTCESLGHYTLTGTLRCGPDCSFDRSECGGRCGDNVVEPLQDEECDLTNLNSASCVSLGFSGGTLACTTDCRFNIGACVNLCGNGIRDTGEACDDANTFDGDGCSQACELEPGWTCDEATPNACDTTCGDGIVAGVEECDLDDFGGDTCLTLGYHAGELACTQDCLRVTDDCLAAGQCGDGVVQDAYEECDGAELDGASCLSQGYYGGLLACGADCAYDLADCAGVGRCGDGLLQVGYGESCDGADLGANTCVTLGYYSGVLACDAACGFDLADCELGGHCGDGLLQEVNGESCDGAELGADTCVTLGYYDGTLACDVSCAHDVSSCGGRCGDGSIQAGFGETCDGTALSGLTCRLLDFFTGALACDGSCASFLTDDCAEVAALSTGYYHSCVLLDDGRLQCWGDNGYGQIGDGTIVIRRTPTVVPGLDSVVSVSAGGQHTCAVLADGSARCWGSNLYLQLGSGLTGDSASPLPVQGLSGAVSISAGTSHTCARLSDGTVRCWGAGSWGQLGNGAMADSGLPVTVTGLTSVIALDAGEEFTCALRQDQTLWCWGKNNFGQLGDNSIVNRGVPVAVSLAATVSSFSAGRFHACAVLTDGTARCWGYNQNGQLGNGTTTISPTSVPVVVSGLSGVLAITCGAAHTCTTQTDGTGRCWGFNNHFQLGDGTSTTRTSPVVVSSLAVADQAQAGFEHSCARVDGGEHVLCWGWNPNGQLGDGTVIGRSAPVEVLP